MLSDCAPPWCAALRVQTASQHTSLCVVCQDKSASRCGAASPACTTGEALGETRAAVVAARWGHGRKWRLYFPRNKNSTLLVMAQKVPLTSSGLKKWLQDGAIGHELSGPN